MHLDTIQAILLGVAATVGCVFNGYIGSDAANDQWYSSSYRPLMQLAAALLCGVLGAALGTGLSLSACHLFPANVFAGVMAVILVFPASFVIWMLTYLPDFLAHVTRKPQRTA
jgi:hypothetical protein